MVASGNGFTVTPSVVSLQPVEVCVKVNVEMPAASPVTIPPLVTDATAGLLLTHVPPEDGDKVVVSFIHIEVGPVMLTTGQAFTVTEIL